jgi:hypothetical protein
MDLYELIYSCTFPQSKGVSRITLEVKADHLEQACFLGKNILLESAIDHLKLISVTKIVKIT